MDRRFVTILAIIIVVFGGFLFLGNKSDSGSKDKNSKTASTDNKLSNNVYGEGKSGVVLIEYGDYQCPACGQYYPIVKQLSEKYKSEITFQFRNYPLTSVHPNAFAGSRAAEAAGKQNKYWEMHDKLYEAQTTWSASSSPKQFFDDYAKDLGLNITTFNKDYASEATSNTINADIGAGQKIGADSTPTFVLNGKKIDQNPRGLDDFSKLIDQAIASKSSNKSTSTAPLQIEATKP